MHDDRMKAPDDTTTDTQRCSPDMTAEKLAARYLSHQPEPKSVGNHAMGSPEQESTAAVPNASGDWLPPRDAPPATDPHGGDDPSHLGS